MTLNLTVSRRSVLVGLSAATAGGAVGAVTAAPPSEENEALLDAWAAFQDALAAYDVARAEKEAAKSMFGSLFPYCPPEIRCMNSRTFLDGFQYRQPIAHALQDGDGKDYHHPQTGYVWVASSKLIGDWLPTMDGRLASTKRFRRVRALALEFEAGLERARQMAGLPAAREAYWRADSRLRSAIEDITKAEARTPQGLAMKASAITTGIGRNSEYAWTYAANGQKLAEAVNAVLGGLLHG